MNRMIRSCIAPVALTLGLLGLSLPSTSFAEPFGDIPFPPNTVIDPSPIPGQGPSPDAIRPGPTLLFAGNGTINITPGTPSLALGLSAPALPGVSAINPSDPFFKTFQGFMGRFAFTDFSTPTGIRDITGNFIHVPDTDNKLTLTMTDLFGDIGLSSLPFAPHLFFGPGVVNSTVLNTIIDITYDGNLPLVDSFFSGNIGHIAGSFQMKISAIDETSMQIDITDSPVGWVGGEQMFFGLDTLGEPSNRGRVDGFLFFPPLPEPPTLGIAAFGLLGALISRRRKTH